MCRLLCAILVAFSWIVLKPHRRPTKPPPALTPGSQEATEKPGLHTVEDEESQVKEPSANFPNHDTYDKLTNFPMLCNEHYDY